MVSQVRCHAWSIAHHSMKNELFWRAFCKKEAKQENANGIKKGDILHGFFSIFFETPVFVHFSVFIASLSSE